MSMLAALRQMSECGRFLNVAAYKLDLDRCLDVAKEPHLDVCLNAADVYMWQKLDTMNEFANRTSERNVLWWSSLAAFSLIIH
jgi:hypothetical protein